MKRKPNLKTFFDLRRGKLFEECRKEASAALETSPELSAEYEKSAGIFEALDAIHASSVEAGNEFSPQVLEAVQRLIKVREREFSMFKAIVAVLKSRWLVLAVLAVAVAVLYSLDIEGPGEFTDTPIVMALNRGLTFLEGSFGALVMLSAFIAAVAFVFARRFKLSAGFAMVFIAAFMLRSTMSTFFNVESLGDGESFHSERLSGQPFLPDRLGEYQVRSSEVFNKILERISKNEASQVTASGREKSNTSPAVSNAMGERYGDYAENERTDTRINPISTFGLDVDTGSFTNARRFLRQGQLPPPQSVRIEEYLNYFHYDYPAEREKAFGVNYEIAPSPLSRGRHLLRLGIKARDAGLNPESGWNLVFLIDSSGSMEAPNKLPFVKQALHLLVEKMRPIDRIGIVTYSDSARVVLDSTPGIGKDAILQAIDGLYAGGGTNGAAGIDMAYQLAEAHRIPGSVNRVVLATDGDFNVGNYSFDQLSALVENKRRGGVTLTTLGFGDGNINELNMEQLADRGNGNYFYMDSFQEARKVLDAGLLASMTVVAKDVKLQVEFNPANIREYRLIGFDNRQLRREDFTNDKIDAGEVGSGHEVTAIYEVLLADSPLARELKPALRYQSEEINETDRAKGAGVLVPELGFVKIRFKEPEGERSSELSFPMLMSNVRHDLRESSDDLRFAAAVAGFGQILMGSQFAEEYTLSEMAALARGARAGDPYGERTELVRLIEDAASIRK